MKRYRRFVAAAAGAALLALGSAAADGKPVKLAPKIQLTAGELARLTAVAEQGSDALRRFLWRTRMIYNWTWRDLVDTE